MAFVPFTGKLDKPEEQQFVPFTGEIDSPAKESAGFVPFTGKLDTEVEDKRVPERVYQDVAEPSLTSPEEMLTPVSEPAKGAGVKVKPGGFQTELLPEQLKSGVTGLQSGFYGTAAKNNAELLNMMDRIDRGEKIRPIDDVLGYADMDPETKKKTRDAIQSTLTGTVAKTIAYEEERKGYKRNKNADLVVDLADKGDYSKAWQVFSQDPIGVIQQLSVESAPNALPGLVAGGAGLLLRGGVGGLMAGLAGGSFPVEYMASIVDSLRDAGVDLKDAKAVEAKLRDPKFIEEAGKRAVSRGFTIAAADAASGKLLMPFKARQLGKNVARAGANIVTEAGLEMAGEAGAQAVTGEDLKVGQILAEGLGAGPTAVAGTALKSVADVQEQKKAEAKAAEEKPAGEKEAAEEAEVTTAYKQAVARFQRQGYTPADAIRFAEQELEDEGYGPDEIRLGRSELGISVPSGADVDTGVTDESAGAKDVGVAGAGETVDGAGARAGLVDGALDPFREELVKTYGDETANQIIARAAELVTDGALPEAAVRDATTEVTEVVEEAEKKPVVEGDFDTLAARFDELTERTDELDTELNKTYGGFPGYSGFGLIKRYKTAREEDPKNLDKYDQQLLDDPKVREYVEKSDELKVVGDQINAITEPTAAPSAATTELQPPGKKTSPGRPKVVLTPEQKAAKQEQRKLSQAASRNAGRTVEKATKVIDEPFDIGAFPDEDTAKSAQETRDAEVIEALVQAIRIANDPRFRKNKPGQQATALIERFPPDSRIRQIAEARARIGEPSKSLTTTTDEHDPDMGSLNDAQSLLGYIKTFGTAFEKVLAARLRPLLKGVRVVHVANPDTDIPSGKARRSFKGALGMFYNKVIYLNANPDESGQNNETALHESLHGATVDVVERYYTDPASLTANQLAAMVQLERIRDDAYKHYEAMVDEVEYLKSYYEKQGFSAQAAENLQSRMSVLYRLADPEGPNVFGDLREFVTYGMTQPEFQEFLMSAPGEFDPKSQRTIGLFTQFVQAIRKILNMGPEHMSALQDLIIVTDRLVTPIDTGVRTATPAPALARSTKNLKKSAAKVDKDLQKIQASLDANTVTDSTGATIPERGFTKYMGWLNARYEDMTPDFLRKLLYSMQTVDILRWKGDQIPGLVDVDKIQQQMTTMKNSLLEASAKQADKLAAFVRKNGLQTISSTMHLARLKRVSPTEFATLAEAQQKDPVVVHYDKILTDANYRAKHNINATLSPRQVTAYENKRKQRQADLKIVYDSWDKLGKQKNGHEMYIMVRQFYKDNYLAYRAILDDQINALPIDAAAKARLLKSVRLMQEQAKGAPDPDYDGMTLKQMPEEYFPFKRHGDYWLRVTKGPTGREFYAFDSASERNKFLQIRAKQLGKDPKDGDEFSAGDNIRSLREDFSTDSAMLQQMFAAIEDAKADGRFDPAKYKTEAEAKAAFDAYREELKDQLYQTYLLTLPERSFRKQFLHSENVTGFSADVLRNFKQSATAYANQLAKLKYGNEIRNQIQRAKDSLEGAEPLERARLEAFIEVIERRANEEMNPPEPSRAANFLNQFSFLWLLTSAATAMTQLTSVPAFVMPTLNQRYGYGKAGKEFARYATFFKTYGVTKKLANGDVEYTAPSVGSSAMVRGNPVLQRAFQAALDRGITTLTNTSVLTNSNRTPENAYESIPGVAARTTFNIMTALFNGAERMSREITYMMTFKLEYEKTGDFNKAVDVAADTVHELLGRYDNFNRPDILRNFIGKTVGQFKMYAIFVTSWFTRNGYTAFTEGMGKKEGRAALERLLGVIIMGGLLHGTVGQPLYSVICTVIDAILDDLDDEEEKQRRRAENPYTSESSNLRFRYEFLPRHFGHIEIPGIDGRNHRLSEILEKGPISVLTDMNIGSRTSYDGIWFREGKVGKNATETIQNYILENLGPGVSTMMNFVGGIEDFNNGDIQRGLEKTAPAFFKAPLVAYRLSQEGAKTRGGDNMLKPAEVNDLNLISATLGFQPTRLARIQEHNFAMNKEKIAAENSKTEALKELNEVLYAEKPDNKDLKAAFDKIKKHNKRYPVEGFTIDSDTIDRSMDAYEEAKGMTYRGLRMSEKTAPFMLPSAAKAAPVPPKE